MSAPTSHNGWSEVILQDLRDWGARTAPQLASVIPLSSATIVRHLRLLERRGLIQRLRVMPHDTASRGPVLWGAA